MQSYKSRSTDDLYREIYEGSPESVEWQRCAFELQRRRDVRMQRWITVATIALVILAIGEVGDLLALLPMLFR
jgi:hypothetical protein